MLARNSAIVLVIAAATFTASSASAGRGEWTVCNQTPVNVSVAVAYRHHDGRIVTEGWFGLRACGGCTNVLIDDETSEHGRAFLHARGPGYEVNGPFRFCVGTANRFKVYGQGHCAPILGFREVRFDLEAGYRTNLTVNPGGRHCID